MNRGFDDLRALYRAAAPEEEPTHADRRAVLTAIVSAGVAAVTLHTSSAAGKLIAIIPGGAKLFTLGQVIAYAGIGAAVGGSVAVVSAIDSPTRAVVATVASSVKPARGGWAKPVAAPTTTDMRSELTKPDDLRDLDEPQPTPAPAQTSARQVRRPISDSESFALPERAPSSNAPAPALSVAARSEPPSLAAESHGLAAVQAALGVHDITRALQLLDAQDRDYRAGHLAQERAAARVLALCAVGRRTEAEAARTSFVALYPGSPLVRRIGSACR